MLLPLVAAMLGGGPARADMTSPLSSDDIARIQCLVGFLGVRTDLADAAGKLFEVGAELYNLACIQRGSDLIGQSR